MVIQNTTFNDDYIVGSDSHISKCIRELGLTLQYYLQDYIPENHDIILLTGVNYPRFINAINDKYLPEIKKYRIAVRENNFNDFDFEFLLYSVVMLGVSHGGHYVFDLLRGSRDNELFDEE